METWKRIEPTVTHKIDFRQVVIKTFQLPDGQIARRTIFLEEDFRAAGVVAVTTDNKVIVARQFRPGPEKMMNEIPGGLVDDGETPEEAAHRELLEETGYRPQKMMLLGEFSPGGYVNGTLTYYLATGCEKITDQQLEEDEFVTVELLDIEEFIANAKQGKMTDGVAVLAAYDQLMELQQKEKVQ